MNAELQRQHEASKARKARIDGRAPPICRAISAPIVRERPQLPRGEARRRVGPPPTAYQAIEREHAVRVRCVLDAYEAERVRRRAMFAAEMEEVSRRENADLSECAAYRLELLREIAS